MNCHQLAFRNLKLRIRAIASHVGRPPFKAWYVLNGGAGASVEVMLLGYKKKPLLKYQVSLVGKQVSIEKKLAINFRIILSIIQKLTAIIPDSLKGRMHQTFKPQWFLKG